MKILKQNVWNVFKFTKNKKLKYDIFISITQVYATTLEI